MQHKGEPQNIHEKSDYTHINKSRLLTCNDLALESGETFIFVKWKSFLFLCGAWTVNSGNQLVPFLR